MKKGFLLLNSFYFIFVLFSCLSDNSVSESSAGVDTVSVAEEVISLPPPPPPPPNKEIEKEIKENTRKSIFFPLGCCKVEKSQTADCCCEAILEKYKELHGSNKDLSTELNQGDNLLSACRNLPKWQALFEAIDYPETDDPEDLPY